MMIDGVRRWITTFTLLPALLAMTFTAVSLLVWALAWAFYLTFWRWLPWPGV